MIPSKKTIKTFFLLTSLALTAICCTSTKGSEGPYFGNGFRNGWADQNSISIWTRLTSIPNLNQSGMIPALDKRIKTYKQENKI